MSITKCCNAETYADPTADPYGPIETVVRCSKCNRGQTYSDLDEPGFSSLEVQRKNEMERIAKRRNSRWQRFLDAIRSELLE